MDGEMSKNIVGLIDCKFIIPFHNLLLMTNVEISVIDQRIYGPKPVPKSKDHESNSVARTTFIFVFFLFCRWLILFGYGFFFLPVSGRLVFSPVRPAVCLGCVPLELHGLIFFLSTSVNPTINQLMSLTRLLNDLQVNCYLLLRICLYDVPIRIDLTIEIRTYPSS